MSTISPDGKWMWNGTEWMPMIVRTDTAPIPDGKPPTIPNTKTSQPKMESVGYSSAKGDQKVGKIVMFISIFMIFSSILWIIYAVSATASCEADRESYVNQQYQDTNNSYYGELVDSEDCWVDDESAYYPLVIGVLFFIPGYYLNGVNNPTYLKGKADTEFASGNIVKAKKFYKKLGDLAKLEECSAILNENTHITNQISSKNHSSIGISKNYSNHNEERESIKKGLHLNKITSLIGIIGSLLFAHASTISSEEICEKRGFDLETGWFDPVQKCQTVYDSGILGLDVETQYVLALTMIAASFLGGIIIGVSGYIKKRRPF